MVEWYHEMMFVIHNMFRGWDKAMQTRHGKWITKRDS